MASSCLFWLRLSCSSWLSAFQTQSRGSFFPGFLFHGREMKSHKPKETTKSVFFKRQDADAIVSFAVHWAPFGVETQSSSRKGIWGSHRLVKINKNLPMGKLVFLRICDSVFSWKHRKRMKLMHLCRGTWCSDVTFIFGVCVSSCLAELLRADKLNTALLWAVLIIHVQH